MPNVPLSFRLLRLMALAGAVVACGSLPCRASADYSALCDAAAGQAARETGVPVDLLLAITRAETGRGNGAELRPWPWAINQAGQGSWFDSADAAVAAAEDKVAKGQDNFDVGCFQISQHWHGDAFASMADMFDPVRNARYAAQYILQLYSETQDWSKAIAAYHSRTDELGSSYLERIVQILDSAPAAAAPSAKPEHPNLFPLLQAGAKGSAASLVPMFTARGPLIGGSG